MNLGWGEKNQMSIMKNLGKKGGTLLVIGIILSTLVIWRLNIPENPKEWEFSIDQLDYPKSPFSGNYRILTPGEIPVSNPLKGYMPYAGEYDGFEYMMEFQYFSIRSVFQAEPYQFNFSVLETTLEEIADRGHQAVVRFYLDYPEVSTGVPQYLIDEGVTMHEYSDYGGGISPDYDDPRVIDLLIHFIERFAENYDGDPRLGFIQVGLLGFWGEWHTYPHENWFANTTTQNTILTTYKAHFNQTLLLVRYADTITAQYDMGFHDDSFAYSTLGDEDWYFYPQLQASNMEDRWKTAPIGGELRPEIQISTFQRGNDGSQDLMECIDTTHMSWLLAHDLIDAPDGDSFFENSYSEEDLQRAQITSRRMGYTFTTCYSQLNPLQTTGDVVEVMNVSVAIANFGVSPFYYNWTFEFGILNDTDVMFSKTSSDSVLGLMPNELEVYSTLISLSELQTTNPEINDLSHLQFAMRIPNPLAGANAIRFANAVEDQQSDWVKI